MSPSTLRPQWTQGKRKWDKCEIQKGWRTQREQGPLNQHDAHTNSQGVRQHEKSLNYWSPPDGVLELKEVDTRPHPSPISPILITTCQWKFYLFQGSFTGKINYFKSQGCMLINKWPQKMNSITSLHFFYKYNKIMSCQGMYFPFLFSFFFSFIICVFFSYFLPYWSFVCILWLPVLCFYDLWVYKQVSLCLYLFPVPFLGLFSHVCLYCSIQMC